MSLYSQLLEDLKTIGIEHNFTLILKPYSKSWFGAYRPQQNTITLYVYKDIECTQLYPYKDLLLTLIHEAVHCIQWGDPHYTRVKGTMHNPEFYCMYAEYAYRADFLPPVRSFSYSPTPTLPWVRQATPLLSPLCKRKGGNKFER